MVVLVVDDDPSFNELVSNYLTREGFQVISVHSSKRALETLAHQHIDLVLADYKLPEMDGLALIEKIKTLFPSMPVVLITNYADIRVAVNSIKLGAFEFVSKPVIPDELLKIINQALSKGKQNKQLESNQVNKVETNNYIVGKNEKMVQLWKHLTVVAPTMMNVLITGESGTGKEHIARTIHNLSRRSKASFIAVDCGTLSTELSGSELFGHVKGAFTGANADKTGLFEEANGGTLFLDEISNLSSDIQVQLLRAIQERTIKKVGSNKSTKIDVRLVAATNSPLLHNVDENKFRHDLYHRLNEFELYVPPLRQRLDDLDEYCSFFIESACKELRKKEMKISEEVKQLLIKYHWPGNVRELENIIKRAVLLSAGNEITADILPAGLKELTADKGDSTTNKEGTELNLKDKNQEQEKQMIIRALEKFKFNKSKAATALNIDRSTLYKKIKDYNIDS
jgi:two-component system, NtrC family, response regulator HydG